MSLVYYAEYFFPEHILFNHQYVEQNIFLVICIEVSETIEQIPAPSSMNEEVEEPVAKEKTQDTPGFTALAGIVFFSLAVLTRIK
ncbi:hypothetical protein SAMN04488589_1919 [Methanolobus vulcani]|uniref:PGF-CTERM protein n=1 Tax=Methanolobus vulcani TaxID=38026 RepID=A0A7Z7B041_9EURY|nr:hypothetical protein SAMN04488589_1919 [Methanolobus vulcani]